MVLKTRFTLTLRSVYQSRGLQHTFERNILKCVVFMQQVGTEQLLERNVEDSLNSWTQSEGYFTPR